MKNKVVKISWFRRLFPARVSPEELLEKQRQLDEELAKCRERTSKNPPPPKTDAEQMREAMAEWNKRSSPWWKRIRLFG